MANLLYVWGSVELAPDHLTTADELAKQKKLEMLKPKAKQGQTASDARCCLSLLQVLSL